MTIEEFLKDKNIVILGFGKQGRSTLNFIRKHFQDKKITIADKNEEIDKTGLDENIEFKLGENYLKDIDKFDLIIKAPGVVLKDENISSFKNKIITDYELLLMFSKGFKIGVTGTKGKSTTSTVLYNVLKDQGKNVFLLGNIGNPILDYIDEITDDSFVVIEVSSHTLEFVKSSPDISILLDIFPEHLDHVNTLEDYINAKFNIAVNPKDSNRFIFNAENELMRNHKFNYRETDVAVCLENKIPQDIKVKNVVYLKNRDIYFNNEFLMNADEPRKIKGEHQLNNMMFILAVSQILGLDLDKTVQTIKTCEPLEHRMEFAGRVNEIDFYDDAIATIPIATINCIKTLENVDTLIVGGMDRGVPQDELIDFLKQNQLRNIICMPETGNTIYDALKEVKHCYKTDSIEEAVEIAKMATEKGKSCVLSPAASSYNNFKNFEEKGNLYKKCIK